VLVVPPLRERREDVLRLAQSFLEQGGARAGLSVRTAEALLLHDWPYNVRELEQVVAAALVKAEGGDVIRRTHLPPELVADLPPEEGDATEPAVPPLELQVARDEVPSADELRLVIERFQGNLAQVARYFGKERPQIYRWAARHGIDLKAYRGGDEQ
jgi:arginine utilization regulatory protein